MELQVKLMGHMGRKSYGIAERRFGIDSVLDEYDSAKDKVTRIHV